MKLAGDWLIIVILLPFSFISVQLQCQQQEIIRERSLVIKLPSGLGLLCQLVKRYRGHKNIKQRMKGKFAAAGLVRNRDKFIGFPFSFSSV